MKPHIVPRSAILLLALLPLTGAYSQQLSPQDPALQHDPVQRAIAALPPVCTLRAPGLAAHGAWLGTTTATPGDGSGPNTVNVFGFDKPVTTRALRMALNRLALKTIEKVETRDDQGDWHDAGPVAGRTAPAGCEYVWLEHALPQTRPVGALRFSFRRENGTVTAANVGVLQERAL